jgi:hypothetical protein
MRMFQSERPTPPGETAGLAPVPLPPEKASANKDALLKFARRNSYSLRYTEH